MDVGGLAWAFYKPPWITFALYGGGYWLFFLNIAVFATIIPFGFFFKGLNHLPSLITGITSNREPVMAGIMSFIVLGKILTTVQLAGCALIISAVVLLQLKAEKRASTAESGGPELGIRNWGVNKH